MYPWILSQYNKTFPHLPCPSFVPLHLISTPAPLRSFLGAGHLNKTHSSRSQSQTRCSVRLLPLIDKSGSGPLVSGSLSPGSDGSLNHRQAVYNSTKSPLPIENKWTFTEKSSSNLQSYIYILSGLSLYTAVQITGGIDGKSPTDSNPRIKLIGPQKD
jgi:hypothetical protein